MRIRTLKLELTIREPIVHIYRGGFHYIMILRHVNQKSIELEGYLKNQSITFELIKGHKIVPELCPEKVEIEIKSLRVPTRATLWFRCSDEINVDRDKVYKDKKIYGVKNESKC